MFKKIKKDMNRRISSIRNLRTIKGLRNDELIIDLGKTFEGELKSWMKKSANSPYYRVFEIIDNRYLKLSKEKTADYIDENGCIIEEIAGKWYFDVEQTKGDGSCKTIYMGRILFTNDISCTNGIELFPTIVDSIFNNQFNNFFS